MAHSKVAWIYFLRDSSGAIKIGRSLDPRSRISDLGYGQDQFLGAYLAHPTEEQVLHVRFTESRISGEWFTATEELEQLILQSATTPWADLYPIENFRLSAKAKKTKKTYGMSLNAKNPRDAELMRRLDQVKNQSDFLRTAALAYIEQGSQPPPITEQELNDLRAQLHWYQQNQPAEPAATTSATTPGEASVTPAAAKFEASVGLSEAFMKAAKKAALPGLKLNDPASEEAVAQAHSIAVWRGDQFHERRENTSS